MDGDIELYTTQVRIACELHEYLIGNLVVGGWGFLRDQRRHEQSEHNCER